MNPAEVVIGEVQGDCGPMVFELLAEGICEPRQTPDLHSHREVLPFHVRSADLRRLRVSADDGWAASTISAGAGQPGHRGGRG